MLVKEVVLQPTEASPSSARSHCSAAVGQIDSSSQSKGTSFLFHTRVNLPFHQPNSLIHNEVAQSLYPVQKEHLDLWVGLGKETVLSNDNILFHHYNCNTELQS